MPFASYDDLIAEVTGGKQMQTHFSKIRPAVAGTANTWESTWGLSGFPSAGGYGGVALEATQNDITSAGALAHGNAVTPDTKHILVWGEQTTGAGNIGTLQLYDRLLHYPSINANTAAPQTLTNPVSLPRYTTGMGVYAFIEVTTTLGGSAATIVLNYTNQDGTAGQLTQAVSLATASVSPRIPHSGVAANQFGAFIPLASGDSGIRSVQSVQLSAPMGAGVISLVLAKPLAMLPLPTSSAMTERDFVFQLAQMPRVFDSACLAFLHFSGSAFTSSSNYTGYMEFGWG